MKRFEPFDLLLTILVACIAAFVVMTGTGLARVLLGLALTFVLPGYAILSAWYPRWLSQFATGGLLILMLSITTAMLGGLVLHYTPWGLQPSSWAVWMAGLTIINSVIALVRREDVTSKPKIATALPTRLGVGQMLLMAASAVVVVIALSTARTGVLEQPRAAFTQLWIEPSDDTAAGTVLVGVHSEEDVSRDYRLELITSFDETSSTSGDEALLDTIEFTLAPQQTREMDFSIDVAEGVTAMLYRLDDPDTVYRSVHLASLEPTNVASTNAD